MDGKHTKDSRTTMTQLVLPNDTNAMENLFGGSLMKWIDIVAAICASKHAEALTVTASVDHISFQNPIRLGDVVTLTAEVSRAWNSSMEIYIEVHTTNIKGGDSIKSNHAYFTFVAIDEKTRRPTPVPALIPNNEEERKRYESANRRKEIRLILSNRLKPKDAKEVIEYFEKFNG